MEELFCGWCGKALVNKAAFCQYCGKPVNNKSGIVASPTSTFSPMIAQNQTEKASLEDTITHLHYAADLEKTIYTYQLSINRINAKISALGHPRFINEPKSIDMGSVLSKMIIFIPAFITSFLLLQINSGFFTASLDRVAEKAFIISLIIAVVLSCLFLIKEMVIYCIRRHEYNSEVAKDKQRVVLENVHIEKLKAQRNVIGSQVIANQELLKNLYRIGILYPSYQNLIAVITMLEYLLSGRCDRLTGSGGAYDTYSYEEKLNKIATKLDVVISLLHQIKNQQAMLYEAIQESISISEGIYEQSIQTAASLNSIAENTALTAYNTRMIERNTRISAYIDVFKY